MSESRLAKAAAEAGAALKRSARSHKQSAQHHRRQSKADMEALEHLKAACDDLGIELVLEEPNDNNTESKGGHSGEGSGPKHPSA